MVNETCPFRRPVISLYPLTGCWGDIALYASIVALTGIELRIFH